MLCCAEFKSVPSWLSSRKVISARVYFIPVNKVEILTIVTTPKKRQGPFPWILNSQQPVDQNLRGRAIALSIPSVVYCLGVAGNVLQGGKTQFVPQIHSRSSPRMDFPTFCLSTVEAHSPDCSLVTVLCHGHMSNYRPPQITLSSCTAADKAHHTHTYVARSAKTLGVPSTWVPLSCPPGCGRLVHLLHTREQAHA